jgi:hypothetical protein
MTDVVISSAARAGVEPEQVEHVVFGNVLHTELLEAA